MYKSPKEGIWTGRNEVDSWNKLWHQKIRLLDLCEAHEVNKGFGMLGFESDEGVKRNQGRVGAKNGPDEIRKALCNLAVHVDLNIFDTGNVCVEGENLESGQKELSDLTGTLLNNDLFPILMGGGHEITYGHVKGVYDFVGTTKRIGVINFDPHFDLRSYADGSHSGSWARQLFDEYSNFSYFPIGINEAVNVQPMFELMQKGHQSFISMDELLGEPKEELIAQVTWFIDSVDYICLTLDLDVFTAGVAPGVSAVNPYGALPHHIKPLMKEIVKSSKTLSFDVAEMNPEFDDGRTAKLAGHFILDVVSQITR